MDQITLVRLLNYDPETGCLTWRERVASDFSGWGRGKNKDALPEWRVIRWNKRYAGCEVNSVDVQSGYSRIYLFDRSLYKHRVIWVMLNGPIPPKMEIDHINGNRADNRLVNLRLVSVTENAKNRTVSKRNTSGVNGVHFDRRRGVWVAKIRADGVEQKLGDFPTKAAAAAARKEANDAMGFTVRGEAAA